MRELSELSKEHIEHFYSNTPNSILSISDKNGEVYTWNEFDSFLNNSYNATQVKQIYHKISDDVVTAIYGNIK